MKIAFRLKSRKLYNRNSTRDIRVHGNGWFWFDTVENSFGITCDENVYSECRKKVDYVYLVM